MKSELLWLLVVVIPSLISKVGCCLLMNTTGIWSEFILSVFEFPYMISLVRQDLQLTTFDLRRDNGKAGTR